MVHLIPNDRVKSEMNNSNAEWTLYNKLKELSDDFYVFHSLDVPVKDNETGYLLDKEIDFIIFNPYYGILCVEVKGGEITGDSGKIYQKVREGYDPPKNYKTIDPLKQIRKVKYELIEQLSTNYPKNFTSYAVNSLAWFIDIDRKNFEGTLPLDYNLYNRTLWKNNLENIENTLIDTFKAQLVKRPYSSKNDKAISAVIETIAPKFNAIVPLKNLFDEHKVLFESMTQDQIKTMNILEDNDQVFIEGLAGSGKSLIALEKAKRLTKQNERVLIVCFNKFLIDFFNENLKEYSNMIQVMNMHNLVKYIKGEYPENFTAKAQNQFLDEILNDIEVFKFKHIIIDEAQDFTGEILQKLYMISKSIKGKFYLFFDKYQRHVRNNSLDWILNQKYITKAKLNYNCRNTQEISVVISKLTTDQLMESKYEVNGSIPKLYVEKNREELMSLLSENIKYYQSQDISLHDMVILSLDKSSSISTNSIKDIKVSTEKKEGHILYTTARKFKGLEADVVFIVDGDFNIFKNTINKNLFYIALSRALHITEAYITVESMDEKRVIPELEKQYLISFEDMTQ